MAFILFVFVLPIAAGAAKPAPVGDLVLIGGGEKPVAVMKMFVELAGGPEASIVIIPTASAEADTGAWYVDLFRKDYGATNVIPLEIQNPKDGADPRYVEAASHARGIFFSGGDQRRIMAALAGTPVLAALREAWQRGAVVGGTSAGTACQSPLMITGDGDFEVIRAGAVELVEGLGFFPGVIVDQHFIARQRFNRLASVILEHPDLLGVGIDEDTAIHVRADGTFTVIGAGSVMVIDPSHATVARKADGAQPDLGAHGLTLHILLDGERFDLRSRKPLGPASSSEGAS